MSEQLVGFGLLESIAHQFEVNPNERSPMFYSSLNHRDSIPSNGRRTDEKQTALTASCRLFD